MASYELRLAPTPAFLVLAAVSALWAVGSRLQVTVERTVLAIICTLSLSIVLVDAAGALTAAAVLTRRRRQLTPLAIGLAASFLTWLVAVGISHLRSATRQPWDGWAALEWGAIAAGQLAVGAVRARRRPAATSFGPGLLIALGWYAVVTAPRFHAALYEPGNHPMRWSLLLAGFVLISVACSIDPAHRCRPAARG